MPGILVCEARLISENPRNLWFRLFSIRPPAFAKRSAERVCFQVGSLRLITQTWRQEFGRFAVHLPLPLAPVTAIDSVSYFDAGNVQQVLDPGLYALHTDACGAHVVPQPGNA